jgi:hypothetical protein
MAYRCEPHPGQEVFVDYRDGQTQLLCRRRQPGSHQQASSSFTTGNWTQPPELWRSPHGQFIHIYSPQGPILIQINPNGLEVLGPATIPPPIEVVSLQVIDTMPSTHPHRQRHQTATPAWATRNHHDCCPACGQLVRSVRDRFCANCGQKLA